MLQSLILATIQGLLRSGPDWTVVRALKVPAKFIKLAKEHRSPSFTEKSEGSSMKSSGEILELLIEVHFPANEEDCAGQQLIHSSYSRN